MSTSSAAAAGLTVLCAFILGTMVTWWAVGILKWDKFTHDPFGPQARMLRLLLGVLGGTLLGFVAVLYAAAMQFIRTAG